MGSGPNVQMGHPQIGPNLSQSKGRGAWLGALSRHGCVLAVFTTLFCGCVKGREGTVVGWLKQVLETMK